MKKLSYVLLFILGAMTQLSAQQETLFNRSKVFGVWAGPLFEVNSFNQSFDNSYGGGGGFIIDQFFIGAYGLGSANLENLVENEDFRSDLAHGGLWVGYTYKPYKLIHPYASVRVGWGALDVDFDDNNFSFNNIDQVNVITPELGVELNVTSFFHVAATAGYRYVSGINETSSISQNDLNGFNLGLSFRLGWFGNWSKHGRDCD